MKPNLKFFLNPIERLVRLQRLRPGELSRNHPRLRNTYLDRPLSIAKAFAKAWVAGLSVLFTACAPTDRPPWPELSIHQTVKLEDAYGYEGRGASGSWEVVSGEGEVIGFELTDGLVAFARVRLPGKDLWFHAQELK